MTQLERRRRLTASVIIVIVAVVGAGYGYLQTPDAGPARATSSVRTQLARDILQTLPVKGRAPRTGYSREHFGGGWGQLGNCDMRNRILQRDLTDTVLDSATGCAVLSGTLSDPYTGTTLQFTKGAATSQSVQIDHIVAVADAWQKGAQQLSLDERTALYNDPLNLLAVEGRANMQKSDGDAATWLPPHKPYRCRYVARQIAVKAKYRLWVTQAERTAMLRILHGCPEQRLPITSAAWPASCRMGALCSGVSISRGR